METYTSNGVLNVVQFARTVCKGLGFRVSGLGGSGYSILGSWFRIGFKFRLGF